jgi:hypothetical protein
MPSQVTVDLSVSFRWWFRPAVALLDLAVRIKPAQWQADLLALVAKHGIRCKADQK